jgi:2-iminobutanoate/2-iminopropanoate deaminase
MANTFVNPPTLFPSLQHGFSQVVVASGGRLVFVSGQTAWDSQKNIVGGADLLEQARQALRNLQAALEAAGGTLADVVSLRIYIVDYEPAHAQAVSAALKECFRADAPPASTWIGVAALAVPDFLIEIEATAVLDQPISGAVSPG